jgi:hypothetical protein
MRLPLRQGGGESVRCLRDTLGLDDWGVWVVAVRLLWAGAVGSPRPLALGASQA